MLKRIFHSTSVIQGTYRYCSATMSSDGIKNLNFDQLKSALSNDKVYLIDVREKQELIEDGALSHTVNIPLGEIENALQLPAERYNVEYNYEKPSLDTFIVFSCKSGRRSLMAANTAVRLGFKNVGNYMGGYLDWANHTKEQCS